MSNVKYSGLNTIKAVLNQIASRYATKDVVAISKSGLVPAPTSSDAKKVLSGKCTWQNESVSISDDNTYVPLDGGET